MATIIIKEDNGEEQVYRTDCYVVTVSMYDGHIRSTYKLEGDAQTKLAIAKNLIKTKEQIVDALIDESAD